MIDVSALQLLLIAVTARLDRQDPEGVEHVARARTTDVVADVSASALGCHRGGRTSSRPRCGPGAACQVLRRVCDRRGVAQGADSRPDAVSQ